jgi:hypothetical protein
MTTQPVLPGIPDWTEPQTVNGSGLARLIEQAGTAGFLATRMRVVHNGIYELQFYRPATATPAEESPRHSKAARA